MGDVNALVVFYSRRGTAEKLALAAGLGAIQADANIRLRRVADARGRCPTIEADPAWKENLARMNRDYVVPRPADPVWADVIILATPAEPSSEIEQYVASLASLGTMTGKLAAPLAPGQSRVGAETGLFRRRVLRAHRHAVRRGGRRSDRRGAIVRPARHRNGACAEETRRGGSSDPPEFRDRNHPPYQAAGTIIAMPESQNHNGSLPRTENIAQSVTID